MTPDGGLEYMNPAAEALMGWTLAQVGDAQELLRRVHPTAMDLAQSQAIFQSDLTLESPPERVFPMHCGPDKIERWVGMRLSHLPGGRVLVTANDRTDRVEESEQAVQELRAAAARERMRSLSHLASGVAHRVSNLLQSVQGRVELAAPHTPPEHRVHLDQALQAAQEIGALSHQLRQLGDQGARTPDDASMRGFDELASLLGAPADPHQAAAPTLTEPDAVHVLVVDDEPSVKQVMVLALQRAGFSVAQAGSGPEALDEALVRAPDVLVTDVNMPRMTGPELARTLRATWPDLPVVFVSGHTQLRDRDASLRDDILLPKPFNRQQLIDAIRASLRPS